MNKPFQVTFTNPDRPDYEITEIYQTEDEAEAERKAADALNSEGFPSPRGGIWWGGGIGAIVRRHEKDWV